MKAEHLTARPNPVLVMSQGSLTRRKSSPMARPHPSSAQPVFSSPHLRLFTLGPWGPDVSSLKSYHASCT